MIEGWTSEDHDIDKFIKDTIYNARNENENPTFLEWVPFNKITDIKQIGKGGFSEMYSAIWDKSSYIKLNYKVALKKLNGSQNMSTDYLNKVYIYIYYIIIILFYLLSGRNEGFFLIKFLLK
jgi:hypothetical protein